MDRDTGQAVDLPRFIENRSGRFQSRMRLNQQQLPRITSIPTHAYAIPFPFPFLRGKGNYILDDSPSIRIPFYKRRPVTLDPPLIPCVWNHQQWINNLSAAIRNCEAAEKLTSRHQGHPFGIASIRLSKGQDAMITPRTPLE